MTKTRVRIAGPDSTRQWRVVRVSDGEVVMDGFGERALAFHWAEGRRYHVENPTRARKAKKKTAKKTARKNPAQLLTLGNPGVSSRDLAKAKAAYKRFHGIEPPDSVIHHGAGEGILIGLGQVHRIDYGPRRGQRKGPIWFHHFGPGCVLCTSPDGKRLVVLDTKGRKLVDFERGIIR